MNVICGVTGDAEWLWLYALVVLTWCGADVGLVDLAGIIVHWAYPHTPLVALDL